jgi:2-oxoisovalerate dehydrogenase E1 component
VYNKGQYPGPNFMIPFGKARRVRKGTDVTVVACGALVQRSLVAARVARERHGISTEVIDPHSLAPFDMETISESVKKTNRVIVAHEDSLSWGRSWPASATSCSLGWTRRSNAWRRWIRGWSTPRRVERATLPEPEDVLAAIEQVKAF